MNEVLSRKLCDLRSTQNLKWPAEEIPGLESDQLVEVKGTSSVPMASQAADDWPPPREYWIQRIDQARGTITLSIHALLSDYGPDDADTACALDLVNQELQRLRNEIDESRIAKPGREDSQP
jgi:hypothetical protein